MMASINKLPFCLGRINSRLSFTVSVFLLLHFNYLAVRADNGILSYNGKYTNRQRLFSVSIPDLDVNNDWTQTLQDLRLDLQKHRYGNDRVKRETKDQATSSSNLKDKPKAQDDKNALLEESKIEFSRSVLNGTQNSSHAFIHWVGKAHDSERIFVLTCRTNFSSGYWHVEESQMWWSKDYGTTFQEKDFHGANISYFYTFPTNAKKLLFTDVEGKKIYTTKDELENYLSVDVPVEPDIVLPHPSDEDMILLYSLVQRKLYFSPDFGTTWNLFAENVLPNFYWGQKGYDKDEHVVHMEIEALMPTHSKYKVCAVPDCAEVESEANAVRPFIAYTLVVHKEYMFVKTSNADESDATLLVSYMRGPFEQAHFPGNVKTNDFIFLNLDDGQVFIAVNHEDHVNLYLSDATGHFFVLSFSNIYHIPRLNWFEIDFREVKGMNWTFLANRRDESSKSVITYISFDKGGNWAPLVVDEELKKSCNVVDKKNCSLQLYIKQSNILASVMSQENAPGIILSHGFLGSAATKNLNQEVSVFSSRDGGVTWKKAPFSGTYQFNILDQGSILTAVPDGIFTRIATNVIHYSCDEGLTWHQANFDTKGVIVKGILTEPGILTLVESIFGHEGIGHQPWTIIKADYGKVLKRKCENQDYEDWTPRDPKRDSKCIMGIHMKFKRRRQDASCYNDVAFIQRVSHNDTCECTDEDFECDFGYHENEKSNQCVRSDWYYDGYLPVLCEVGKTYKKSTGYRKVASDTCRVKDKSSEKHFVPSDAKCPSVLPHGLKLMGESQNIATGKEAVFHLHQAGGSEVGVTYTWDFGDSETSQESGFENASSKTHIYKMPGIYNVTVTAGNSKGKAETALTVHVYDRIHDMHILAPWAGQKAHPLKVTILVQMTSQLLRKNSEFLHFVWRFGDEDLDEHPILSWNNSMTHTYKTPGVYQVSVEAVNSISSLFKQLSVKIYDDATTLALTFGSNVFEYNITDPVIAQLLMMQVRKQLAEDIGLNMDRLEAILVSTLPPVCHLYIFPSDLPNVPSVKEIKDKVIDQVSKGLLGVNLLGKTTEPGKIISITSAKVVSDTSHSSKGPNLKAVYIAAPVLIIAVISSLVLVIYCRRKMRNVRQFSLLTTQDDSDALLDDDDDDEPPLDLNVDFGVHENRRDENILDAGGSHLVMVTGSASGNNQEIC